MKKLFLFTIFLLSSTLVISDVNSLVQPGRNDEDAETFRSNIKKTWLFYLTAPYFC
jgi:hypothetical protein